MPKGELEWTSVVSSNIGAVAYDEESEMLYVEFRTGQQYSFDGVPQDEFENLRDASSVGSYFNQFIKSQYRGHKI